MFLLGVVGGLIAAVITTALGRLMFVIAAGLGDQTGDWILGGIVFVAVLLPGLLVSGGGAGLAGGLVSGLLALRLWCPSRRWLAAWLIFWTASCFGVEVMTAVNANPESSLISLGGWSVLGALLALGFALIAPPWAQRR